MLTATRGNPMGLLSANHATGRRPMLTSSGTCQGILFLVSLISFILSAAPEAQAFQVSPTSLNFTGLEGGSNPPSQTVIFSKNNKSPLGWTITDDATWLAVTPLSGTMRKTARVTISINTKGLAAGSYTATMTITTNNGDNASVPVTLTVTSGSTSPTMSLSPSSLTFSGTQGGANPAAKTLSITNTGGGTLSWTVSDNAAWLSLSPASGTAPGSATASVNTAGLAAGTYNATITATATGATNTPQAVAVTLTVTAPVSQSAIVTNMVPDGSGATVTIQGPGQVLEFIYNAQSTYTGISSFIAGTASFRHTFSWPQGTTFACYRTRGTDNLYTEQACASVTPGPPPTSGTATLTWSASTSSDVTAYKVYLGTASGVYNPPTTVGNLTTYQMLNLTTGQTYYFSVTAVDTSGNESSHSNEVSKSIY